MEKGMKVKIIKGVHKGREGVIHDILFNEYRVYFKEREVYWFDLDEIERI